MRNRSETEDERWRVDLNGASVLGIEGRLNTVRQRMASYGLLGVFLRRLGAAVGVHVLRDDERVALMRIGRYMGLRGPGLVVALPLIDRCPRIALDKRVPGWRGMSPERLEQAVRETLGL